jgi:glyoxylase-like metal-dependent hydrolase (beta-lactamase superfamily II)
MGSEKNNKTPAEQPPQVPAGPLEVRPGCWLVGRRNPESLLQCNTYIRSFDQQGSSQIHVCVDPGSQLDFPVIEDNITQLIGGLDQIQSYSINHQDPDVIGNAMFLHEANPDVSVMVTEDVWRLAQHLIHEPKQVHFANSVRAEMPVDGGEHRWQLVPTPFCHFRGAMAFYDRELRTLFTGDLFGGLNRLGRVHLFAEESDWAGIAQFHQIYMPTREVLRYAVRQIRALQPSVQVIAPQHGHVIAGGLVELFLERMHELLVGHDLLAMELDEQYLEGYRAVFARVLAFAANTLGRDEVFSRLTAHVDDGLVQFIRVHGKKHVELDHDGYSAIVRAVARLGLREPLEFCNGLRSEVLTECTIRGLPIPPVGAGLEEGLPHNFISPDEMRPRAKRQQAGGMSRRRRRRS